MTTTLKRKLKPFLWPIAITLLLGWYFADNFKGYYRFKALCSEQGGLKVYQPLERDVGWFTDRSFNDARYMASFEAVAFVRYRDKDDGLWYDLYRDATYRTPMNKGNNTGYRPDPADMSKPVIYQRIWTTKKCPMKFAWALPSRSLWICAPIN